MLNPAIVCLLFFGSGLAGLVFEVVWCRLLLRALGAGAYANACVFAAFMAGAALGARCAWRFPQLLARFGSGIKAYGRLELLAGISGLIICLALGGNLNEFVAAQLGALSGSPWFCNLARFVICFLALILPCFSMGAGLAVLVNSYNSDAKARNLFPVLYGCNTLGAALGSAVAAFVLLPFLGITISALTAAAIDASIFIAIEALTKSSPRVEPSTDQAENIPYIHGQTGVGVLAVCVFVSGFLALILEISWTRIFSLVLGSSVYSVGVVLLMVLAGAGISSLLVQLRKPDSKQAINFILAAFMLTGIYIVFTCYQSDALFSLFASANARILKLVSRDAFMSAIIARILLSIVFVFLPSALLGAVLPLASTGLARSKYADAPLLYATNCLGAFFACCAYPFILFPAIQQCSDRPISLLLLVTAVLALIQGYAILARQIFLASNEKRSLWYAVTVPCLIVPLTLIWNPPKWNAALMSSGALIYGEKTTDMAKIEAMSGTLLTYKEGINSTVSASMLPANNSVCLRSDGKVEATLPIDRSIIAPGSDISTHVLLGALPVLFHEHETDQVLLIGMGSGVTASALLSFPEITKLTVAELEPAVIDLSKSLAKYNGEPISDSNKKSGRISIRLDDARFVLASSPNQYDAIISQPADPWVSGSSDLYTEEFWRLAASRLREKGVFCQWIQLYAIPHSDLFSMLMTFKTVFKSVYICHAPGAGELLIIGFKDGDDLGLSMPADLVSPMEAKIKQSASNSILLANAGISNSFDALGFILSSAPQNDIFLDPGKKNPPLNTDDKPFIEYSTCRTMLSNSQELEGNMNYMAKNIGIYTQTFGGNVQKMCEAARALSRLAMADSSPFHQSLANNAFLTASNAVGAKKSASTFWTEGIVLRALFKTGGDEVDKALHSDPGDDDASKLAIFDAEFERGNLQRAEDLLQSCSSEFKKSGEWSLRQAFLHLKFDKPVEAFEMFDRLQKSKECYLPALLGGSYAAYRKGDLQKSAEFCKQYLSIDPWDFQTQMFYTLLLCRAGLLDEAYAHAECAEKLRPKNTDAQIIVLKYAIATNHQPLLAKLLQQLRESGVDTNSRLGLLDYKSTPEKLLENPHFIRLVNEKIQCAEDSKNGYKILGEP